jgi:hypothetical protein
MRQEKWAREDKTTEERRARAKASKEKESRAARPSDPAKPEEDF